MSVLHLRELCAGYGGVDIVEDISFDLASGEILAIAGTNGSGKSTLIKAIMGLAPRVTGLVELDGIDLLGMATEQRVARGIGYVPQVRNVFATLSVEENLEVVETSGRKDSLIEAMYERFPALAERRRMRAGDLSGGERQQLALARALMLDPKIIVLDEPTAALSTGLVEQVLRLIRELPTSGAGVLLVEQRARLALEIADRGVILDQGRMVMADSATALLQDERMAELYLGHAPT